MKKKLLAVILTLVMTVGLSFTGCSSSDSTKENSTQTSSENNAAVDTESSADNSADSSVETSKASGTILLMSNMSDGIQYEDYLAYLELICGEMGYTVKVIYGDGFNDPAGNLTAVKNAMTDDVVGLIAMQDGGISNILDEFPNLYVIGFNSSMASVYGEGGASAAAATNSHFLGTIADGFQSGVDVGKDYAKAVISKGYKKVSVMMFPSFAYPEFAIADASFRAEIDAYNSTATAEDQITVVGEAEVLNFEPVSSSYFLDANHQNLDGIVGLCAGISFIYPELKAAIANGTNSNTKLLTGGFSNDEDIMNDIGGEGVIQYIAVHIPENIIYCIALLDNAIYGTQYSDYTASECIDGSQYFIDSVEDINNLRDFSGYLDADMSKTILPFEEAKKYMTRYNASATYADLKAMLSSDTFSVDSLGTK